MCSKPSPALETNLKAMSESHGFCPGSPAKGAAYTQKELLFTYLLKHLYLAFPIIIGVQGHLQARSREKIKTMR